MIVITLPWQLVFAYLMFVALLSFFTLAYLPLRRNRDYAISLAAAAFGVVHFLATINLAFAAITKGW